MRILILLILVYQKRKLFLWSLLGCSFDLHLILQLSKFNARWCVEFLVEYLVLRSYQFLISVPGNKWFWMKTFGRIFEGLYRLDIFYNGLSVVDYLIKNAKFRVLISFINSLKMWFSPHKFNFLSVLLFFFFITSYSKYCTIILYYILYTRY